MQGAVVLLSLKENEMLLLHYIYYEFTLEYRMFCAKHLMISCVKIICLSCMR